MTFVAKSKNNKEEFLSNFVAQDFPQNLYLLKIKEEAELALRLLDVPTTRSENWKYTRVAGLLNRKYTQTTPENFLKDFNFWKTDSHLFVFINGFFSAELSKLGKEEGAFILPLSMARRKHPEIFEKHFGQLARHKTEFFTALNTVYHTNGAFIYLNDNTRLIRPVHMVNLCGSSEAAFNPRNLIILGKNSSAKIISSFEAAPNTASTFANVVTEIFSEENSNLEFNLIQNENSGSAQINTTHLEMKSGSHAETFCLTTSGALVRNNLTVSIEGENSEARLNGIYIGNESNHIDNHTLVEHKKPGSYSNELYKGIMGGKSTGVFNGKVLVSRDAQKTNAFQSNQNILLSDSATVDSKPELEIYANDVKCSHGSTTGQLDDEAIFYLRSRGISESQSKQLLLHAFASEAVNKISLKTVKEYAALLVEKTLNR